MMNLKNYSVLVGKKAAIVIPKIEEDLPLTEKLEVLPLDFALNNITVPFITYGLPKNLKKYIEKKTKNFFPKIKTKYPKYTALVQSPVAGTMIDLFNSKEKIKEWFPQYIYVMSLEEAKKYSECFKSTFFASKPTEKLILNSLDIYNY